MHRHHVYVSLGENNISAFRFFCQIQGKKIPAFVENEGLRAVHVFGLPVAENTAGEADDVPAHVDHREHEPVAEGVVAGAVFDPHEPGAVQLLPGVALGRHGCFQAAPVVRRVAQTEVFRRDRADAALLHVLPGGRAAGGGELLIKEAGRVLVEGQHAAAFFALKIVVLFRDLHPDPAGQKLHSLGEGEVFDLHDEVDDPAALAAAEAVVDLLVGGDGEGGRFFTVEGAETEHVRAAFFRQPHVARHHVHNIVALGQFIQKCLGKRHVRSPPFCEKGIRQ